MVSESKENHTWLPECRMEKQEVSHRDSTVFTKWINLIISGVFSELL